MIGTQLLATGIAAAGLLMTPIGWDLIALAWGYAFAWILLLDQVKLIAYAALDRSRERAGTPPPDRPAPAPL